MSEKDFSLIDNTVVTLVIEKTKLKKEKYNLIITKTIFMYIIVLLFCLFSYQLKMFNNIILITTLIISTTLMFIVYLYIIEHFNKVDKDFDELLNLLRTKSFLKHNETKKLKKQ